MFLHVIPAHELHSRFSGSCKDMSFRVSWLQRRFPGYRQVLVTGDEPAAVDAAWRQGEPLEGALVEFSLYPRIVRRLRARAPEARVVVRSINIEPLQHLDNSGWWPERGPLWLLYGVLRLWVNDMRVKSSADAVLSINEWEGRTYWQRMPGRACIDWLPYCSPGDLIPGNPLPYAERRTIACMPTSHRNRKSLDLVTRFQDLARIMKRNGSSDEFVITGDLSGWDLPECAEARQIGFVEDIAGFLGRCKAVAILSPLGFGIKTTIMDALAAGAHALVHPTLIRRHPAVARPFLVPCDGRSPRYVEPLAERLRVPPDGARLHAELRARAEAVMERWASGERRG